MSAVSFSASASRMREFSFCQLKVKSLNVIFRPLPSSITKKWREEVYKVLVMLGLSDKVLVNDKYLGICNQTL